LFALKEIFHVSEKNIKSFLSSGLIDRLDLLKKKYSLFFPLFAKIQEEKAILVESKKINSLKRILVSFVKCSKVFKVFVKITIEVKLSL
jgi:hypothetical protein